MVVRGVSVISPAADHLIPWGANFGPLTLDDEAWRLVTCLFIHVGILHLAFNLWVLWQIGPVIEQLLGPISFSLCYLLCGILSSLASLGWNQWVVSAGASGAIFGLFGLLLTLIVIRMKSLPLEHLKPLRNSLLSFIVINLALGAFIDGIDMAAHVGGLLSGALCGLGISPWQARFRKTRTLIVFVVGIAIAALAWQIMPKQAVIAQTTFDRVARVEASCLTRFNELIRQRKSETIDDNAFLSHLENEVIAPWNRARRDLELLTHALPPRAQQYRAQLLRYMTLREAGWNDLRQAIRTNDRELYRRAEEQQHQAETTLNGLNAN